MRSVRAPEGLDVPLVMRPAGAQPFHPAGLTCNESRSDETRRRLPPMMLRNGSSNNAEIPLAWISTERN